jgi:hypothetical protein
MRQVLDFPESSGLLRKWAGQLQPNCIKGLARFWAGSAQSYPQLAWKASKGFENQPLGSPP